MIQGLMMTPPVVGRIAIGKVVERNGKRLPEKDDEFTITTQVQNRSGWILHPIDTVLRTAHASAAKLRSGAPQQAAENPAFSIKPSLQSKLARRAKEQGTCTASPGSAASPVADIATSTLEPETDQLAPATPKLRSIPVRLLFNDPSLNLRALYTLFERTTGRPICVGDGANCKRMHLDTGVLEPLPCPGPVHCSLGMDGHCKLFGRLHVRIDHPQNHSDACSTFVLRTTGINTVRTVMARMQYFQALSGGLLAYLPLELRLRGKSTTQSHRAPIYYVDLCIRQGLTLEAAVLQAREAAEQAQGIGLDQAALDAAAREGYAQGLSHETGEDAAEVLQEFYPAQEDNQPEGSRHGPTNQA